MKVNQEEIVYMKDSGDGVYVLDKSPEKTLKQKVTDRFGKNDFAKSIIDDLFNFGSEDKELRKILNNYEEGIKTK